MIYWQIGTVVQVIEEFNEKQIVMVKHNNGVFPAIHYLQFHSLLSEGDQVIINQTATKLNLGTGGYDFVVSPLIVEDKEESPNKRNKGHIMKLRYTPYQFSVLSCEEQNSPYHEIFMEPKTLEQMPVLIGELHSMLPVIITVFRQLELANRMKKKKIVYIMTDGGALPIHLSKHVEQLKNLGWLDHTITIGQAFGGDLEAINIYTGLIAARYIYKADFVIVLMGPGIAGTGTWLGHTGVEQGEIINAVSLLEGIPITIVRTSLADNRARHYGISHHTLTNLKYLTLTQSLIPYPNYLEEKYPHIYLTLKKYAYPKHNLQFVSVNREEVYMYLKKYPYSLTTMSRAYEKDQLFFEFVASGAYWVFNHLLNSSK